MGDELGLAFRLPKGQVSAMHLVPLPLVALVHGSWRPASRRTPASGPSRPRAAARHRRHHPWASSPLWCLHHMCNCSSSRLSQPVRGAAVRPWSPPPAGRGPGHRPKGVDPPPSGSPRRLRLQIEEALGSGCSQRKAGKHRIVSHEMWRCCLNWVRRCFPVPYAQVWMIRSVTPGKPAGHRRAASGSGSCGPGAGGSPRFTSSRIRLPIEL